MRPIPEVPKRRVPPPPPKRGTAIPKKFKPDTKAIARQKDQSEAYAKLQKIIKLLDRGLTYNEIAYELSITGREAHEIVMKALEAWAPKLQDNLKQVKDLELYKLDILEAMIWKWFGPHTVVKEDKEGNFVPVDVPPSEKFVNMLGQIQTRRDKLLGLEAARKMEVETTHIIREYRGVDPDAL